LNLTLSAAQRAVFDASAALAFAFQDEPKHAEAVALVRALASQNVTLCAPALFAYEVGDRARAFQIARDYEQPRVYDASYAAHAGARGLELVTTDKPFFEAVNGTKKPKTAPPLSFVRLLI